MRASILVVDDSAFMRRTICETLSKGGIFSVIEARDGEEAVSKFLETMPNLILMDINMPNKNGIDAAKEILSISPSSKIIILTAVDQEWAREEAIKMGVKAFISKPFKREELVKKVYEVLTYDS